MGKPDMPSGDHRGRPHRAPHGPEGHERAAALGLTRAIGTIKSIIGTTLVLTTEHGAVTVATDAETNFHGLSRSRDREMGYRDVSDINTLEGLSVGQRVGVIGARRDDATLLARGVHFPVPAFFGDGGGDAGHTGHGGHGGHGRGMFDPANIERLLGERRRASLPPEHTLRAAGVAAGQAIVDLGCGPGYFTLPAAEIAGPSGKVYGVDVQPEMLEACRERAAAAGVSGVELVQSDGIHVPLPDAVADLVFVSVVLHETKDRAAFLREARRLLKPAGEVALIEFTKWDGPPGPPRERRLSAEEIAAVAGDAGLRVLEQRTLNDLHVLYHLAPA